MNQMVAIPRAASVRLPVVAVPAERRVKPLPCVRVTDEALLLYIEIASPAANVLAGIVRPALIAMHLPMSATTAVPVVVERGMFRKPIVTPSMVAAVATEVTEPLSVILPVLVTVPDKDRPLAEPVPLTEVTVPLPVPAPRFARAAAALVAPVPPFATASVPPRVRVPLPVIGPPESVRPVVPPDPETDVTVPPPAVDAMVIPPALFVTDMPEPAVSVAAV